MLKLVRLRRYIVGSYVTWQALAYISIIFPVSFLVAIYFVPETPRFLLSKGQKFKAAQSLLWFRGAVDEDQIEQELTAVSEAEFKI